MVPTVGSKHSSLATISVESKSSICGILIVVYYNPLHSWVAFHPLISPLFQPSVWSDLLSPKSRRCDEDLWHRHPEPLEASESFQRSGIKITSFFSHSWDKPWRLAWHLKISPWKKRRFLLETIIFRFRVKLLGCMSVVPMKGINTKGRFLNTSGLFFVFVCIFNLKYDGITILLPLSCSSICRRHTLHIYVYIYIIPYTLGLFNVPHGSIVFFFR